MTDDASQKAEEILQRIITGKKVRDAFSRVIRDNITISGQTFDQLEAKFKIQIDPTDLNPQICKELDAKLWKLGQEAAFAHAVSQVAVGLMKSGNESAYRDAYTAVVEEYRSTGRKVPAASTLANIARSGQEEVTLGLSVAEVEERFWKDILSHLDYCRKLLDNATFSNNTEAKLQMRNGEA